MSTNILLLGAAGFVAVGTFRLPDPLLPAIAEEFGTSIGSVAITVTAFTLGYALFQLLHGPLGDRLGKLRVIAGMLALTSLTTVACGWADTVSGLAALRFAAGMTAGAVAPLSIAHIGDTVPYDSRMAMIARFLMAALVGQMAAGSLAGFFAEYFGWRPAFVVFGIFGLIIAAGLWPAARRAPRPGARDSTGQRTTHFTLARERQAQIIWARLLLHPGHSAGARDRDRTQGSRDGAVGLRFFALPRAGRRRLRDELRGGRPRLSDRFRNRGHSRDPLHCVGVPRVAYALSPVITE